MSFLQVKKINFAWLLVFVVMLGLSIVGCFMSPR